MWAQQARRLGLILSQKGQGVGRACDLVEVVLTMGVERLVPHGRSLPWAQAMLLDVYAVYGLVLCGVAVILKTCSAACLAVLDQVEAIAPIPSSAALGGADPIDPEGPGKPKTA